jgi:hypothetical protein
LTIPLLTLFSSQKEALGSIHDLEAQTLQAAENGSGSSRYGSPLPGTNLAVSQTGAHEMEALLSTKESDKLAIERVEALKGEEEQEKQETKTNRTSIVYLRKSPKSFLSKDSNKSASGYSLKVLAEVLETAASKGDVPLVTSLLSLYANTTYASIKSYTKHTTLAMAARKGHNRAVDVPIPYGTQLQVKAVLIQACCKNHVGLAIKLVTEYHANIYPQRLLHPAY